MKNKRFLKNVTIAILYGFFMWSAGWVSVRIYDMRPMPEPATTKGMLIIINEERQKQGVAPVILDANVSAAAKSKACDMRDRKYFEHQDPQGQWGWHFLTENSVIYDWASENISKDTIAPDAGRNMRGFMNSPEHKAIILDPKYRSVGYASCGAYTVQFFVK